VYIAADLQIINDHFCVDYQNFGIEGIGGQLIQDFRIYNQGGKWVEYVVLACSLPNDNGNAYISRALF